MGIFTLDLSKELNVICHSDDVDEVDAFKETIKDYIVWFIGASLYKTCFFFNIYLKILLTII